MRLSMEFRGVYPYPVDAACLLPERLLSLPERELAAMPLAVGKEQVCLGDICRLEHSAGEADELRLAGETACLQRVGSRLSGGRVMVDGDAGRWAGAEMQAGELILQGSASHGLGAGMCGGLLRVVGNAGGRTGGALLGRKHGMQGGVLIIDGNAGRYAGERMRRGLIFVGGDVDEFAGLYMHAGTLLVAGSLGGYAGVCMRRGSLVAGRCQAFTPGYTEACRSDFVWLRLALRHLAGLGAAIPNGWPGGRFRRFTGCDLNLGKGELLLYDPIE